MSIFDAHREWSLETFDQTPDNMFLHLEDELVELRKELVGRTDKLPEELADIVFMVNSIASRLEIDLEGEMWRKLEVNKERVWKHGRHV